MSFEEFLAELDPPLLAYLQDYTPEHPLPHTVQRVEMTLLSLPLYLVGQLGRLPACRPISGNTCWWVVCPKP